MEMSGGGLIKQKEQYGKQCVNKKGKEGAMGNKTPKERRDRLDCLAPLEEPLNISEQENYKSKRDWTTRNSMSLLENWVNPKQ